MLKHMGPWVTLVRVNASVKISKGGSSSIAKIVNRRALKSFSALRVGLEGDGGDIAALMPDPYCVGQVCQSSRRHPSMQRRFRNTARPMLTRRAEQ